MFFLLYALIFVSPAYPHSAPEEMADMKNVLDSRLIVEHFCEYNLYTPKNQIPVKKIVRWIGTASFIEHSGEPHLALSAGHIFTCESNLPDDIFDKTFVKSDVISYTVSSSAFAIFKEKRYTALVVDAGHNGLGDLDIAILNVILPKSLYHYHQPILRDENAYGPGSQVIVVGFTPELGAWRLRSAIIEEIDDQILRIDRSACGGNSGGPVLYWHKGKYHIIGIVIATYKTPRCGQIDTTVATRLTKTLVEKIDAKTAPK